MYPIKELGWRWLGKSCEFDQIYQSYPLSASHNKSRQPECHQMLGWHVIRSAPILQGAHWSNDLHGIRVDNGAIAYAKINGRRSTESEIVGADDALPQCLWSIYFIEGWVYALEEIKSRQDNMSAVLMENSGKDSITKQTNHTRVWYFFIKGLTENGYLSLKYCPTGEMYAYLFTKPLQGGKFQRLQYMIQGIPESTPDVDMSCPRYMAKFNSKECVWHNNK